MEREALLRDREKLLRLAGALKARLAQNERDFANCVAVGRVVGMKVPLPDWERVAETSLQEEMQRVDGGIRWEPEETFFERDDAYCRLALEVVDRAQDEYPSEPPAARTPSLRQIALDRLAAAGHAGIKAAAIRDYARRLLGDAFHEKTIGMTLNRLAKEGLTRRAGRLWFEVSQKAEQAQETAPAEEALIEIGDEEPIAPSMPKEERLFLEAQWRLAKRRPPLPRSDRALVTWSGFFRRSREHAARVRSPYHGMIVKVVRLTVPRDRRAEWRARMEDKIIRSYANTPGLIAVLPGEPLIGKQTSEKAKLGKEKSKPATADDEFCLILIFDNLQSLTAATGESGEAPVLAVKEAVEKVEVRYFQVFA